MNAPETKREDVVEEIHGIEIHDPYRWLEDGDSPGVKAWTDRQNEYTDSVLRNERQQKFFLELEKDFAFRSFSNPVPIHGRYFFTERKPGQDQTVLYFKDGVEGQPVKLVDPNGMKSSNTITIDFWAPSFSGKQVVYGLSENGDEMATLYVMDVGTQTNLPDTILRCRYSGAKWLPDDSGFYYKRNPQPGTVPVNEEHLHSKVYLHQLGDSPENDKLIFGENRPKDDMIGLSLSVDGRFLAINVSHTWTENEVYVYDREKDSLSTLITGIPAKFVLTFLEDKVLMLTNYQADNFRILSAGIHEFMKPVDSWTVFCPETEHKLETLAVTKSKILLEYLENACSKVVELDYTGRQVKTLPLPEFSSLLDITTRRIEEEFFYAVDSFTRPKVLYRFDPKTNAYAEYDRIDNPITQEDYVVKQEWFTSRDGTKVPMFVFHKKEVTKNGANPTILYGYGGFASNLTPAFMRNWVPWLERGGVIAVANIRGGGEFGEKWHEAGIKDHKQNSFDDFIAAAECLLEQQYANSHHLGILGGSNGGLLVSAVAIQRPELFRAVCSRVPLTDMLRFHKFGMAVRWVHEYGNPEIVEDVPKILKWSPYHNVKVEVQYPSMLFTTGEHDSRVHPLHSRKMAALLQSTQRDNKVLLHVEKEAGHGAGKPISKNNEEQSLVLSFYAELLGLKVL